MKRKLIIVVAGLGILYLGDFLSLRLRIPGRDIFGSVTVHTYYVVKLKSGKTEYDYAGDHDVNCTQFRVPSIRRQAVLVRPPKHRGTDQD